VLGDPGTEVAVRVVHVVVLTVVGGDGNSGAVSTGTNATTTPTNGSRQDSSSTTLPESSVGDHLRASCRWR
jgi:hypothetical protein